MPWLPSTLIPRRPGCTCRELAGYHAGAVLQAGVLPSRSATQSQGPLVKIRPMQDVLSPKAAQVHLPGGRQGPCQLVPRNEVRFTPVALGPRLAVPSSMQRE